MLGCDCPHGANRHAPLQDFGTSMCLEPDCECDGTRAQVAAMRAERERQRAGSIGEQLVETIRGVLSNPYPRTVEDQARNIAQALVANFRIEVL